MATKTWNQTSGNLASTDANWSPASKPEAGDDVVFDGTSTANCTWDLAIACATFTIASGYTGTITRSADFSVTDWSIASTTAVFTGSGWVTVNGDMTKSAGGNTTFPEDTLSLRFQGTKNCSLDAIVYPNQLEVVTGTRTMTAGSSYFQGRYHTKIYSGATFTLNQGAGNTGFSNRMAYYLGWTFINEGTINGNAKATFFYIVGEGSTPGTITFGVINCPVTIENYYVSSNRTLYLGANTSFGSTLLIQSDDTKTITLDHGTNYTLNVAGIATLGNYGKMTPGTGAWTFGSLVQSGTGSAFTMGGSYVYLHDLTTTAGLFTGDEGGWQWVYSSGGDISIADTTLASHTLNLRMTADGGTIAVGGEISVRNLQVYGNTTITDLSELRDYLYVASGKTLTNNSDVLHDTWAGSFDITNEGTVNGTGKWTVRILYGWTMGCTKLGDWNCPFEVKNIDASNACIFNLERNEVLGSSLAVYSDTGWPCTIHHNSNYTLNVLGGVTLGWAGRLNQGTGQWWFSSLTQSGLLSDFTSGGYFRCIGTVNVSNGALRINADAMVNALVQSDGSIFVNTGKCLWYTFTWTHTGGTYSGSIEHYIFSDTDTIGLSDAHWVHKQIPFEEMIAVTDSLYVENPPPHLTGGPAVSTSASKYLLKKWHDDREKALIDQSLFTTAELEWLEITSLDPIVSKDNDEEWLVDNQPIDPLKQTAGRHDVRKRPEAGG